MLNASVSKHLKWDLSTTDSWCVSEDVAESSTIEIADVPKDRVPLKTPTPTIESNGPQEDVTTVPIIPVPEI